MGRVRNIVTFTIKLRVCVRVRVSVKSPHQYPNFTRPSAHPHYTRSLRLLMFGHSVDARVHI